MATVDLKLDILGVRVSQHVLLTSVHEVNLEALMRINDDFNTPLCPRRVGFDRGVVRANEHSRLGVKPQGRWTTKSNGELLQDAIYRYEMIDGSAACNYFAGV